MSIWFPSYRKRLFKRRRLKSRQMHMERFEPRTMLASDFTNNFNELDVNNDGFIFPIDALIPINDLNANGARELSSAPAPFVGPFIDVSGDGVISPIDALRVISELNDRTRIALGEDGAWFHQGVLPVELGQTEGTRTLRLEVKAEFDASGTDASTEDLLLIYLTDPDDSGHTLLDRGRPGTTLFSLAGTTAEFPPGTVQYNGQVVEVDLTSLGQLSEGELRVQLVSADQDQGSKILVRPLSNDVDPDGLESMQFPLESQQAPLDDQLDLSSLLPSELLMGINRAEHVETQVSNVRLNSSTGRLTAEMRVRDTMSSQGRGVALIFEDLPAGVTIQGSRTLMDGTTQYVSLRDAIPTGGLGVNTNSSYVTIEIDNPNLNPFSIEPSVYAGEPNSPPAFDPIGPLSVMPGDRIMRELIATDPDGDPVTFSIRSDGPLPTGMLSANPHIIFTPTPDEIGSYTFDLIASDGTAETVQTVILDVVADPVTTTRVSGVVQRTDQQPLAGVRIQLGDTETTTAADGSFTLETATAFTSDALIVHGEEIAGDDVYPYIAEKLHLLIDHDLFDGQNNVITRPIYLPALDVAGGTQIDPANDTVVEQEVAPGLMASVTVQAGTLGDQNGNPFSGTLSITEVPPDLTPAALPRDLLPSLVVTIQPGDMVFAEPAPLTLPNLAGDPPGTLMDLWSINPTSGEFDIVGTSRVTADGQQIETIEGGIRNSSWHLTARQRAENSNRKQTTAADKRQKQNGCGCEELLKKLRKEQGSTSEIEQHSGSYREEHAIAAYQSLSVDRALIFHYDSVRADPRPIVPFGYDNLVLNGDMIVAASLTMTSGSFSRAVPGIGGSPLDPNNFGLGPEMNVWNLDGLSSVAPSLQVDLRDAPSGIYNAHTMTGLLTLDARGRYTGILDEETTQYAVVNSINSPFGAGWGIEGLFEAVRGDDGSVLLVNGNGAELLFEPPAVAGQSFVSPASDFSTLEELPDGTLRRTMTNQTVYQFGQQDKLVSVTDRNGNATVYEYDAQGRLVKVTDPVGLETVLQYDGDHLSRVIDPANRETTFEHDEYGNLTRIGDPDGTFRTFSYDAEHHLTQEINKRGFTEQATYGFHGRVIGATRKDGSEIHVAPQEVIGLLPPEATRDRANLLGSMAPPRTSDHAMSSDPNGNVSQFELDQLGQHVAGNDAEGAVPSVQRDEHNLPLESTDVRGNRTMYTYDDRGNLLTVHDEISRQPIDTPAFRHPVYQGRGTGPVYAEDLNDDGLPDLITRDGLSMTVSINRGGGRLADPIVVPVNDTTAVHDLEFGDVNGDGIVDAVTYSDQTAVFVQSGNGRGEFSGAQRYDFADPIPFGQGTLGDLNDDGHLDLIALGASQVQVALNDGTGSFLPSQSFTTFAGTLLDVGTGDFDGDGNLDVVVSRSGTHPEKLHYLFGDGQGGLGDGRSRAFSFPAPVGQSGPLQTGDMNADGLDDVVVGFGRGDLYVVTSDDDRTFEWEPPGRLLGNTGNVINALVDVNADGRRDIITSGEVLLQQEDGSFVREFYTHHDANSRTAVADIDGDGSLDLAGTLTNRFGVPEYSFAIRYGKGDGRFAAERDVVQITPSPTSTTTIRFADLNGDSLPDRVISAFSTDTYRIFVALGEGHGMFGENVDVNNGQVAYDFELVDMDNDTILDLVYRTIDEATPADTRIAIQRGLGNGLFDPAVVVDDGLATNLAHTFPHLEDLNDDGILDIVVSSGTQIAWRHGLGGLAFADPQFANNAGAGGSILGDFNNDGAADLFLIGGRQQLHIGDGSGGFQDANFFGINGFTFAHRLVGPVVGRATDLNNDGLDDVVMTLSTDLCCGRNDGIAVVFAQADDSFVDGIGVFQGRPYFTPSYQQTNPTRAVRMVHFNGDGDQDIIQLYDNTLHLLFNDGRGGFEHIESYKLDLPETDIARSFDVIDLNGDNALDVVVTVTASDGTHFKEILNLGQTLVRPRETYTYDPAFSQMTSMIDGVGDSMIYEVDPANGNRLTETVVIGQLDAESGENDDLVTRYTYTTHGLVETMTDPLGRVTAYDYDEFGRLTTITHAVGSNVEAVTLYEYDAAGNLSAEIDENGHRTEFTYDELNRLTNIRNALLDDTTLVYDESGNLLNVTDVMDNTTAYTYDVLDRRVSTTDAVGSISTFAYDSYGNLLSELDRLGRETQYAYDRRYRLVETINAEDGLRKFAYDVDDNLIEETDENGNLTRHEYDARDRRTRTIDAHDNPTVLEYARDDNLIGVTDEILRRTEFTYDEYDRLIEAVLPDPDRTGTDTSPVFTNTYDLASNLIASTDALGNVTNYEYDDRDRLIRRLDPDPDGAGPLLRPVTDFEYDEMDHVTQVSDPLNRVTTYEYDALYRVTEETYPDPDQAGPDTSPVMTYVYDAIGNELSMTDALGNTTEYEYNDLYELVSMTDPDPDGAGPLLSPVTTYTYDEEQQLISVSDPLQRTTTFEYDLLGRLVTETYPDPDQAGPDASPVMTYEYDPYGNELSMTDALGNTTQYEYDALHRLIMTTEPDADGLPATDDSPITTFEYDDADQLLGVTDPLGRVTRYEYDDLGRVVREIYPDPDKAGPDTSPVMTYVYDLMDNLLSETDALDHSTTYAYDELYRRIGETDANGDTTRYTYDLVDNLLSLTDPVANTTTWVYDDLDRVIEETNQLNDTRFFSYDLQDNLLQRTDRNGRVIEYGYDNLYRTTDEVWKDAGDAEVRRFTFTYDVASQMLSASDPSATYEYTYDDLSRVIEVRQSITGLTPEIVFTNVYDLQDNRLQNSATIGGVDDYVTGYTYDNLYRTTRITQQGTGSAGANAVAEKRIDYTYDVASQRESLNRFEDLAGTQHVATTDYVFDLASRLTDLTHRQDATILADYNYTFDAGNRITRFVSSQDGVADYNHDERNQLTAADYDYQDNESYEYDENGNRTNNGFQTGVNNRLSTDGTFNYEYDAEGNRIRRTNIATGAVTEYDWDHRNRLVRVTERDSASGSATKIVVHAYDFANQWVMRSVDSDGDGPAAAAETFFIHDNGQIVLQFEGSELSDLAHRYLWGPTVDEILVDERITAIDQIGNVLWSFSDHLGTVRDLVILVAGSSQIANHRVFDSFGNVTSETDDAFDHLFAFTGRPIDGETGLQNNLHRWFDQLIGQWFSEDPIGFLGQDSNLYRYVENQAIVKVDPSGLFTFVEQQGLMENRRPMNKADLALLRATLEVGIAVGWVAVNSNPAGWFATGLAWLARAALVGAVADLAIQAHNVTTGGEKNVPTTHGIPDRMYSPQALRFAKYIQILLNLTPSGGKKGDLKSFLEAVDGIKKAYDKLTSAHKCMTKAEKQKLREHWNKHLELLKQWLRTHDAIRKSHDRVESGEERIGRLQEDIDRLRRNRAEASARLENRGFSDKHRKEALAHVYDRRIREKRYQLRNEQKQVDKAKQDRKKHFTTMQQTQQAIQDNLRNMQRGMRPNDTQRSSSVPSSELPWKQRFGLGGNSVK